MEKNKLLTFTIIVLFIFLLISLFMLMPERTSSNTKEQIDIQETRNVLLISSYSPSFETFFQQIDGIKSVFDDKNVVLDIEFMDSKRFHTEENYNNFYNNLKNKVSSLPEYDVILSADDNALNFVLEHRNDLFPNIPIVFFGVNNLERAEAAIENKDVFGVVEAASIFETIEVAYRLNTGAKRVVAIVDDTVSGQADLDSYYEQQDKFSMLEFTELNISEYSYEDYAKNFGQLERQDIVLLLSLYSYKSKDKASNVRLTFDEGLKYIVENCSQPIYHPYYHGLGDGILGGKVISHFEQGKTAAGIAYNIFIDEPILNGFIKNNETNKYIFDYSILKKYHLSEKALPLETEFVNKKLTVIDEYGRYILFGTVLLIFLIVLIGILSHNIIRKQKAEYELKKQNVELGIQKSKMSDVLNLTARIGFRDEIKENKDEFLSDLLRTSIDIIDEADFGVAYSYDDGIATFVDVIGHDKQLVGLEMKGFMTNKPMNRVIRMQQGKRQLMDNADSDIKNILHKHMKWSNESLIMVLLYNGEKIAGLALEREQGSFSEESLELANLLRNIPIAFFSQSAFYQEQNTMFENMLESIIKILGLHNKYTREHSMNVAIISSAIAKELGLSKNEIDVVYWTGLVHDIGKILIPESVLDKKEKLTNQEWEMIKTHPVLGYEALVENKNLKEIAEYVLHHHERWDGEGFPNGISKKEIPKVSRILAIADAYDAMTSDRPYRKALSKDVAISEINRCSGTQFDPFICEMFLKNLDVILNTEKHIN